MKQFTLTRHPLFKVALAIAAFVCVMIFGTVGYMLIEKFSLLDALYMTVITVSTVGFEEVHPLSSQGQVFTIILIVINLSLLTFFVSYITRYLLDGNFQAFYKRYQMKRTINHLHDHVIICGYGRNGKAAAHLVMKSNIPVVILEKQDAPKENENDFKIYMQADATHDEVLLDAGIEHARALITTLPEDADNLFIVLTAKELNPRLRIISRASNDTSIRKLKSAGANEVIMPDKIGGIHMATLVINPDVKEFIDYMANQSTDVQISELTVSKTMLLADLDCWNKTGATVLGLRNAENNYFVNPPSQTLLNSGDRLIILGLPGQIKKVVELLG